MPGIHSKIWWISRAMASDQSVRRRCMFSLLTAALVMVFLGSIVLWEFFVDHPMIFAIYWLACGWLVVTAVLLAIVDILQIVRSSRAERRAEQKRIFTDNP